MDKSNHDATRRRVVVTGMGTLNPLGLDVATTWDALVQGRNGIGRITQFDTTGFKCRIAGEVTGFDPVALFGAKDARRMARVTQLALAAAGQALAAAGLESVTPDRERMGVLVGSAMGNLDPVIDGQTTLTERGADRVSPFFVPMMLSDTPAAMISIRYGLRGPVLSLATACATATDAIGQAATMIRQGIVDVVVAGGADAAILPVTVAGFSNMGALSTRNDDPATASRPFDRERDGFVMGEGAGILVLEALDHAQSRGAEIYGELLGYGATADAYHISSPAEDGEGAIRAMRTALADATLQPEDIDYINAHGTSTILNDRSETAAIKAVFGGQAAIPPVSSTKSAHGHLLGAAGGLEAIAVLQTLATGIIPPTINYTNPDPECDLDVVPNTARTASVRWAMSNSFGFGGHNAVLIFGRSEG
ncbi:MAG: beta-ketoacyl-ACP synthase II [Chloroflexota bacterium]